MTEPTQNAHAHDSEAVKKEAVRLKKLYKNLPDDRRKLAEKLIERAAFMGVSLSEMEQRIAAEGQVVKMPQGDYEIDRAHPLLSTYNAMIKNYVTAIKQLDSFLTPDKTTGGKPGEKLIEFITGGGLGGK